MKSCDSHVGDVADAFDGELKVEPCKNHSGDIVSNLAPMADRVATLIAIILPFLGLVTAAFILWGWGFSWIDLGLLLGMYVATMFGITVGFHRLFTHGAFETNVVVKFFLAVLGSMAVQGSLFRWVATHRRHHQHSDRPDDPHSPHQHGRCMRGLLQGAWHSHVGWFFEAEPENMLRYVHDLRKSRSLRVASDLFPVWIILGLLIPTVLGGLLSGTWRGAFTGFIWGGLVRTFLAHHVTWSINSACHLWGSRPYDNGDMSRNNFLFGILALGEGWHNTHHAFPSSARHGLRWWQVDASYWLIRALSWGHLAWNVRLPSEEAKTLKLSLAQ
jgi:stearoyl-CoA desaturase (delta-9 desaturase)